MGDAGLRALRPSGDVARVDLTPQVASPVLSRRTRQSELLGSER